MGEGVDAGLAGMRGGQRGDRLAQRRGPGFLIGKPLRHAALVERGKGATGGQRAKDGHVEEFAQVHDRYCAESGAGRS
ncbi:hypothetical protein D3C75_1181490 [compost metagenome]